LSPGLRRHLAPVLLGLLGGFAVLAAVIVVRPSALHAIDGAVTRRLYGHEDDYRHEIAGWFERLGTPVVIGVGTAVAAAVGRWRGRPWRAVVVVVAAAVVAAELTLVLKPLVGRHEFSRAHGNYFPSGHVAGFVALVVATWLLLAPTTGVRWHRWLGLAAGAVGAVALSMAVIILQYHVLTDTVGGALIGWATTLAVAAGLERWPSREAQGPNAAAAARTAAQGTRPSRSNRMGSRVQSTTVDGRPAQGPPSSTRATEEANSSATASAVSGVGWPCRLALVAATGPTIEQSALGTG
jgi:membrane-associated phospholipid phosphatase